MVALVAVVVLLCTSLGVLASAQRARLAARTAADLAALAAAEQAVLPPGVEDRGAAADPCARAAEAAVRNGARTDRCVVLRTRTGTVVEVTASRAAALGTATATATSRAGPPSARAAGGP